MSIKIANDTANGSVTLKGQNVAGDKTITMPNLDCELAPRMQLMTAQNSTSGTSIDFTGIPSWAKKITVMFSGVSTNGTSVPIVQLGSGTVATSGYTASATGFQTTNLLVSAVYTSGFPFGADNVITYLMSGTIIFTNMNSNTWVGSLVGSANNVGTGGRTMHGGGYVILSGILDRIRITTVNGTDTFDAGTINILVEG